MFSYPPIRTSKAIGLSNSSTLTISSLNLFKYIHIDSLSCWVKPYNFVELFLVGMLMIISSLNLFKYIRVDSSSC
jgi:hypothetical protein